MKLWGGRFRKNTSNMMDDFHSSIAFDQRLFHHDIEGSIAHATMLGKQGIIPQQDAETLVTALEELLEDIRGGKVEFSPSAEDIHMNIEELLTERVGEPGKRLHTGRSRNDQVALDMHMYIKGSCREAADQFVVLIEVLLDLAHDHAGSVMPGYTHLQRAQPITLGHHLMAYVSMFLRDVERFVQAGARADEMPLGSGALAGTTYPIDRQFVCDMLGFARITLNSMDAVSDRDFCCDYVYAASMAMMHLSRFCEELVLWSSAEFAFVEFDDAYATGSSIMPQKKNPDVAELVRGKTGRVYGDLTALLTMLKGLPLAYNKDMQEDKEAVFDARDTLTNCLSIFTSMIETAAFHEGNMRKAAARGFANATDAADYLTKKGLPFREAHQVVGNMVMDCLAQHIALEELPLDKLCAYSPLIEEDFYHAISLDVCVNERALPGGPAPCAVNDAIDKVRRSLREIRE